MALVSINLTPSRRELRQFGLFFFPAFAALLGWILLRATGSWSVAGTLWGIGSAAILLGAVAPAAVRPIWVATMLVTYPIGLVLSHVAIGIVYYLVVTPVGLLLRLFKGDPLHRAWDPDATSYWIRRKPPADVDRYFKQF